MKWLCLPWRISVCDLFPRSQSWQTVDRFDAGMSSAPSLSGGFCWSLEVLSQRSVRLIHFVECDAGVSVVINYLFFMEDSCFSSCKKTLVCKLLRYLIGEWSSSMFHFVMWIRVACVVHTAWLVKQTDRSLYVYVISYILCTDTYWM